MFSCFIFFSASYFVKHQEYPLLCAVPPLPISLKNNFVWETGGP